VAGTNGKGSTVAMMRSVLEAAGYKVHAYTSPHLVRFAERIRLAGSLIDETLLLQLLEHVEAANAGKPITFFEVTTAVAFLAFSQIPADVVLLETGLGGRFDATNVIAKPRVTALSSISMDHMQYLGHTLTLIAGEKGAIMKPGTPCVCVAQRREAMDVIARMAEEVGAPLKLQNHQWEISERRSGGLRYSGENNWWDLPAPSLPGRHQYDNAGLALAALDQLSSGQAGIAIPPFAVRTGMRKVEWPARAQRLARGPLVDMLPFGWELWLDGGHNAGAGMVIAALAAESWNDAPLHLVCGMLSTKAAEDYLRPLARMTASFTAIPIPGNDLAFTPTDLAAAAAAAGMTEVGMAENAAQALAHLSGARSRILICGSLYLAGEILKENR
ncbi:MAG: bifunctional folylpolyglutamate synthase/dihydrofolate synthase, partial [Rhodospirillaceae bacterium]